MSWSGLDPSVRNRASSARVSGGDCCHRMTAASDRFSVDPHMGPMATKCTYYIQVAAGRVVWLSFERFVTTEPVLVYDGGHASSRLLLNQTGCGAPASTASSTNSVTVVVPAGSSVDAYYTTSSPGSAFKDGLPWSSSSESTCRFNAPNLLDVQVAADTSATGVCWCRRTASRRPAGAASGTSRTRIDPTPRWSWTTTWPTRRRTRSL